VLAGDLNLFRNTNNPGQRRFDTVFSRLEAYDFHLAGPLLPAGATRLTDCTCGQGDNCDHVETFRMFRPGALPYQDDYVFACGAITTQSCAALVDTAIRDQQLSDHWPVIAQFDLP
jgi:endonuclease/exonuclease/phosphatase family metal-dependent hydrolase